MAQFTVNVVPGYAIADNERITYDILRAIATPTINVIGTISTASIADGSVTTAKLAAGAVTSAKITDANVITAKLADGAVTTAKVLDANITTAKILDANVTTAKLADASVTAAKLSGVATPVTGSPRFLTVTRAGAAPNNKLTATADEMILTGTALSYRATTASVTADVTASGADGLDTGSEANSTWYYLFVIYDGTNVKSLLSISKTAPTLPGGYTYKCLIGAVFNNSSGDFSRVISYSANEQLTTDLTILPTAAGPVSNVTHNLTTVPRRLRWVVQCQAGELGYSVGDEVAAESVTCLHNDVAATDQFPAFASGCSATNLWLISALQASAVYYLPHKTSGVVTAGMTTANWKAKGYAET